MVRKLKQIILGLLLSSTTVLALAGQVEIVKVMLEPSAHRWTFHVTLQHKDDGWKHYADAWRIVDSKGNEIKRRTLWHPHVHEQPFTRSLGSVLVPKGENIIFIEAHDKKHGWNKQRVKIDLTKDEGPRYKIRRK